MQQPVGLIQVKDGQKVRAILSELTEKHLTDFEIYWKPRLQTSNQVDRYWDWVAKCRMTASELNFEKYAIEYDKIAQGLVQLELRWHRSQIYPSKNLVYVDYLATAPWNRPELEEIPRFRGVGRALLLFARQRSLELGYEGRIGLHALPAAEAFYDKLKIANYGPDPDKENLVYFEAGPFKTRS